MNDIISWFATAATIGGVVLTASNLGARITGTGFIILLFGSLAWLGIALMSGQNALFWTNLILSFLNLFGIWRWLGRQANVEKGAESAARASQRGASPSLFPASLLTKGKVYDTIGKEMAQSIDAMMDVRTGRPVYLVISVGGVGGVGETLRRLPWSDVGVNNDQLQTSLVASELTQYDEIDGAEWPAR